jgi:hypothetical protein
MSKSGFNISYFKKFFFILFIVFSSCEYDNFYDTERFIYTDKEEYKAGDKIELSLKIGTKKGQKRIRLYENFKNLEISFSTFNEDTGNQNYSSHTGLNLKKTKIVEYTISKDKPLIVKLEGKLLDKKDSVILVFPKLNFKKSFKKELFYKSSLRIHGLCNPINPEIGASIEEYFEVKDVKVKI